MCMPPPSSPTQKNIRCLSSSFCVGKYDCVSFPFSERPRTEGLPSHMLHCPSPPPTPLPPPVLVLLLLSSPSSTAATLEGHVDVMDYALHFKNLPGRGQGAAFLRRWREGRREGGREGGEDVRRAETVTVSRAIGERESRGGKAGGKRGGEDIDHINNDDENQDKQGHTQTPLPPSLPPSLPGI